MKHYLKYLAAPALCVLVFLTSGTTVDPFASVVPGSGCAAATTNTGPCIPTTSWITPSQASEGVDEDTPYCFTCEEARQVRENRENMSYLFGAAAIGLGMAGLGIAGGITALGGLFLNYTANKLGDLMEEHGC